MRVRRMFRVCSAGRVPPTATLIVLDDDPAVWVYVMPDQGECGQFPVTDLIIGELPSPSAEDPTPTGTISCVYRRPDHHHYAMSWHYFRELPVTGDKIVQSVVAVHMNTQVKS